MTGTPKVTITGPVSAPIAAALNLYLTARKNLVRAQTDVLHASVLEENAEELKARHLQEILLEPKFTNEAMRKAELTVRCRDDKVIERNLALILGFKIALTRAQGELDMMRAQLKVALALHNGPDVSGLIDLYYGDPGDDDL